MEPSDTPPSAVYSGTLSHILQDDGGGSLCTGRNFDSEDKDRESANACATTGQDCVLENEVYWPHWSAREAHSSLSLVNIDGGSDLHPTCVYSIQPEGSSSEMESRQDPTGEVCHLGSALTSLAPDDQVLSDSEETPPLTTTEPHIRMKAINYGERSGCGTSDICSLGGLETCKCSDGLIVGNKPGEALCLSHALNTVESPGDLESCGTEAKVGDGGKGQSVDRKPLDFYTAREQWVKLDTASSKPPQPVVSKPSPKGQVTVPNLAASSQLTLLSEHIEGHLCSGAVTQDVHQRELLHHPCLPKQRPTAQQVFEGSPPLTTVAQEPTNQEASCHGFSSVVAKEQLRGAEGYVEGEEEEQEARQTKLKKSTAFHVGESGAVKQRKADKADVDQENKVKGRRKPKPSTRKGRAVRMEGENGEDNQSDSGVSTDFSPNSTVELNSVSLASDDLACLPSSLNETPIEREIRRAAEREHNLRRSRGLAKSQEFISIPLRRPVLSQPLPAKLSKSQGKDQQFAGKKMQREIKLETQREQVLVKLGKVPGFYDRGSVRQIRERKQLFEALQENQMKTATPSKGLSSLTSDFLTMDKGDLALVTGCVPDGGCSVNLLAENQSTPATPCGPTLSEGPQVQVIIVESGSALHTTGSTHDGPLRASHGRGTPSEASAVTLADLGSTGSTAEHRGQEKEQDGAAERQEEDDDNLEYALAKENPFFKLRSSMSLRPEVEQDIRQSRERERELRKQRNSLYGAGKGGRAASLERHSTSMPGDSINAANEPSKSISPASSARPPSGRLELVWPPPQVDAGRAGQEEMPRSPRTSRQKLPLLQRWESGMMNGSEGERD